MRVWTTVPGKPGEDLVRIVGTVLSGRSGSWEASITPGVTADQAEILLKERERWRAALLVSLAWTEEEVAQRTRLALGD
jgi:hypothetical protein